MRKYTLLLSLLLVIGIQSVIAQGKIERLEPSFWWAGMKNPKLQLLVYGKHISDLDVSLTYPGVSIERVTKVKNPNYLFIDLLVSEGAAPGTFDIRFSSNKKLIQTYPYKLLQREAGSAERKSFNGADAIYLITPDRFANGNKANDHAQGMKEGVDRTNIDGRHGGDIKGISDHLDYIKDLGFTALWITPVIENNQSYLSYHGYAMTDFYKIDARFGTNEDYKQLSADLKSKGMKLIMDMVFNHSGSEHWWIKDLPTEDWLNYPDTLIRTTHRRSTLHDPHTSKIDKEQMVNGWFAKEMPDLNQKNQFLATYLIQNSIWWVEYANLSGIRVDTYPYPDMFFMQDWCRQVLNEYPNLNIVGEQWSENPGLLSYWQKGKKNFDGYDSGLPALVDFPVSFNFTKALTEPESWDTGWVKAYEALGNDYLYPDPDNMLVFPDNHDTERFFIQIGRNPALFKLGMAYFLTVRGIPQIYYGTEILLNSEKPKSDGVIRSDFPGGWDGDKINGFTGKGLTAVQADAQQYLKKLLNWRKNAEVIHNGKMMHYVPKNGVYVYFRYNENHKVMVVLNKNVKEQTLALGHFYEMLDGIKSGKNVITDQQVDLNHQLVVPAQTAMIIEIK